ncbi:DMT family transporter [Hyphomonas sp. NPDC076900]|uniref:DMT family transporter n=1 Tax=unclassified Hyphomonas TaxID=2630699 RepID=UPI003CFFE3DE
MTMPETAQSGAQRRSLTVWIIFTVLTILWAGAYGLTRIAVGTGTAEGLPPEWVLPGRLTGGAIFLLILMFVLGKRLPPLSDRRRWAVIVAMGFIGSLIPFFLITVAQQTVDSSLAALYTAAAPVFVTLGASLLFSEERMTRNTGIGILLGFAGVVALFGPEAIRHFGSASMTAQLLLLLATLAFSASTLIARASPPMEVIPMAAGFITVSAVLSWPMVFTVDAAAVSADWHHWLAVAGLAIGPSGVAQVLYMALVARAGATFQSLTGYSVPVAGAAFGWLFFRETQSWNAALALALILGGVWLARQGGRGRIV